MKISRCNRITTVFFALLSLLFMQLAVASYSCPGIAAQLSAVAVSSQMQVMSDAGMPCAESMATGHIADEQQPNLCKAHCQTGQQSADKHEIAHPVAIETFPVAFSVSPAIPVFSQEPVQVPNLRRTTALSVAVRHCCFRL